MRLRNTRVRYAVHEQPLLSRFAVRPLGHAHERDIPEAQFLELLVHLADLSQSAVDQQQIRRRNLAVLDARIAPLERLAKRTVVIARCHARDVESPVLFLQRPLGPEDHAGRNGALAARVADVEALDARGSLRKIQLGSQGSEHLVHALLLRQPHPQSLRRILLRQLDVPHTQTPHRAPNIARSGEMRSVSA